MSDIDDEQSGSEALDDSELGADEAYTEDEPAIDYPPDRPLVVDEAYAGDDAVEDSFDRRTLREEPEAYDDPDVLVDPDELEPEVPDLSEDDDGDPLTAEVDDRGDEAPPAEESAVHIEPDDPEADDLEPDDELP